MWIGSRLRSEGFDFRLPEPERNGKRLTETSGTSPGVIGTWGKRNGIRRGL